MFSLSKPHRWNTSRSLQMASLRHHLIGTDNLWRRKCDGINWESSLSVCVLVQWISVEKKKDLCQGFSALGGSDFSYGPLLLFRHSGEDFDLTTCVPYFGTLVFSDSKFLFWELELRRDEDLLTVLYLSFVSFWRKKFLFSNTISTPNFFIHKHNEHICRRIIRTLGL